MLWGGIGIFCLWLIDKRERASSLLAQFKSPNFETFDYQMCQNLSKGNKGFIIWSLCFHCHKCVPGRSPSTSSKDSKNAFTCCLVTRKTLRHNDCINMWCRSLGILLAQQNHQDDTSSMAKLDGTAVDNDMATKQALAPGFPTFDHQAKIRKSRLRLQYFKKSSNI